MKLVVWLGNPGDKYKFTRHNAGFLILDMIQEEFWFTQFLLNKKFNAEVATWKINKWPIILVKPLTFMNLSGDAVKKIVNFYKILPKDILVIHDDIDLPLWKIKLKFNWSHWWHNGVRDIINKLKTDKFWRLKFWISRPASKDMVVDYVLSNFKKEEIEILYNKKKEILDKVEEWLRYSG